MWVFGPTGFHARNIVEIQPVLCIIGSVKKCTKCEIEKPLDEFAIKSATRRQSMCKSCNREYQKGHYVANKQTYIDKAKVWSNTQHPILIENLINYLAEHPCVDCGETDSIVLDFDHVTGVKFKSISALISNRCSWKKVFSEIEKCEVRCANCHRRRTAVQFGWLKLEILNASVV